MFNFVKPIIAAMIVLLPLNAARSQEIPQSLQQGGKEAAIRERKNAWTIGLDSGQLEGLYPRFAAEIAKVLDDGDNLRVLPILGYGAASNLEDLLYLRGVDVALTQSDVFEFFKTQRQTPRLEKRVQYLIRLYNTELHILAGPNIKNIADLRGKKVSFGPAGNSATLTGPIIFQRLGVKVEELLIDHTASLEALKKGEISAIVRVVGKPIEPLAKLPADSGLHFLSIPSMKLFDDIYTIGELNHGDYPNLIPAGEKVETIAVPTVLAVYNWPRGSDRFKRLEKFTRALLTKFDRFQGSSFHPKWKEINLAATLPGWQRFSVAEDMLAQPAPDKAGASDAAAEFDNYLQDQGGRVRSLSRAKRDALFRDFERWRAHRNDDGSTGLPKN